MSGHRFPFGEERLAEGVTTMRWDYAGGVQRYEVRALQWHR